MISFEEFCGGEIWNHTLTFDNTWPELTSCFRATILVWVPCGFLWLCSVIYIPYLISQPRKAKLPFTLINFLKTSCSGLLVIVSLLFMSHAAGEGLLDRTDGKSWFSKHVIEGSTFLLTIVLVHVDRVRGVYTSGILFLYWLLMLLSSIVPFYTLIMQKVYIDNLMTFYFFYFKFGLILVQFILQWFSDIPSGDDLLENQCPETTASFPSRLVFWWMIGLVRLGFRKTLEDRDVWRINPRDSCATLLPRFDAEFSRERARVKKGNAAIQSRRKIVYVNNAIYNGPKGQTSYPTEKSPLLSSESNESKTSSSGSRASKRSKTSFHVENFDKDQKENVSFKTPSLSCVLWRIFGRQLITCCLLKLAGDVISVAGPIIMSMLISTHTEDRDWKCYVLVILLLTAQVVASILNQCSLRKATVLGMQLKTVCVVAIYRKALSLSNEAKKTTASGRIINLMSVDCQCICFAMNTICFLFSLPVQITLSVILIYRTIGNAIFAGAFLMVILLPVNAFVSSRVRKLRVENLRQKDTRLKLVNEILTGIKVIKLFAWERTFKENVEKVRKREVELLYKIAYLTGAMNVITTLTPFLVVLCTFATYVLVNPTNHLDANKAFFTLALFNLLRTPLVLLSHTFTSIVQAAISITRVNEFLCRADLDPEAVHYNNLSEYAVSIRKGTFTWDNSIGLTLKNYLGKRTLFVKKTIGYKEYPLKVDGDFTKIGICKRNSILVYQDQLVFESINLNIEKGALVAVVGQVSSGKSSLLSAILGDMRTMSGTSTVQSNSIAYVPQQAWIQNCTLRDNVLFGKKFRKKKYKSVIEACELNADFTQLSAGDMTEIGEKGVNLSGGQKQRVSIARAVYSKSDIYLFDDPLSALDSHVGKQIFRNVIGSNGLLNEKTRILVTHGIHWLPLVDQIIVMKDGRIAETGSYEELILNQGQFSEFLKENLINAEDEEDEDKEVKQMRDRMRAHLEALSSEYQTSEDSIIRSQERRDRRGDIEVRQDGRLIETEHAGSGKVKKSVFLMYARAAGLPSFLFSMSLVLVYQAVSVAASFYLTEWTEEPSLMNTTAVPSSEYMNTNLEYLTNYALFGVAMLISITMFVFTLRVRMVRAAARLHEAVLKSVIASPMAFFETTPLGRIINRLSRDVDTIDDSLQENVRQLLPMISNVFATITIISINSPAFLYVLIPLCAIYLCVQNFYIPTSRQLKRIESVTRSPVYEYFTESLSGTASIRAYGAVDRFLDEFKRRLDKNQVFYFAGIMANRWLAFYLDMIGSIIIFSSGIFAIANPDSNGSSLGLSVSYALQMSSLLSWMVRQLSDLETNSVSIERVKEYSELSPEADWIVPYNRPPWDWPEAGRIEMKDYMTRYRPGLDLALKRINCNIEAGEKVGIVGRTGAGKSSFTLALFRIMEASGGSIIIDGLDIGKLGLHDVRSRLTVLPQEPVLFSGTLRQNLDPFGESEDHDLWRALKSAHLEQFVLKNQGQLMFECGEGGSNLSVGQRQLVCLARALLRHSKILVLDEATAAVDMETDSLIQKTIRVEFKHSTVITVAHRLNTVMDYDKIMVMDEGRIKEFAPPDELLKNQASIFYGMAQASGLV